VVSSPLHATVECGPYTRSIELEGLSEREITRGTFAAFAALVDDPETDPQALAEFLAVTVEETLQLWVYPAEVFLQNLLHRRGDQSRIKLALERLASQDSREEPGEESAES
jgi:hypothetical protein